MQQEEGIDTLTYSSFSSSSTISVKNALHPTSLAQVEKGVEVVEEKAESPPLPDKQGSSLSRYLEREEQLHGIFTHTLISFTCR